MSRYKSDPLSPTEWKVIENRMASEVVRIPRRVHGGGGKIRLGAQYSTYHPQPFSRKKVSENSTNRELLRLSASPVLSQIALRRGG